MKSKDKIYICDVCKREYKSHDLEDVYEIKAKHIGHDMKYKKVHICGHCLSAIEVARNRKVPMEPYHDYEYHTGKKIYHCPYCNGEIERVKDYNTSICICGQIIDWSKVKNAI